jgi:RNA polymerase sigma-70 factor (TIGR02943 family)
MTVSAASSPSVPDPGQWLARFGDELYRFALGRVGDPDTAEELVQTTLLNALDALAGFRGEASERTWLFQILRRNVIDWYRRRARRRTESLDALGAEVAGSEDVYFDDAGHWRPEQHPADWRRADAALEAEDTQQALGWCQSRLPAQQAAVFTLRFVEELSAEEICRELQITSANYWVLVHRAKLALRRCLEKQGFGQM